MRGNKLDPDPQTLPGVRAHPDDPRRREINPGKSIKLAALGEYDAVRNESEYETQWVIKILPPPETIQLMTPDPSPVFGFRAQILANYHGDQFTEYQPSQNTNNQPFDIPLVGVAVGVHGRWINCKIDRVATGALALAAPKFELQVAIIPGRPSLSYVNRFFTLDGLVLSQVLIPVFAVNFCFFGTFTAGDTITQRNPAGAIIQTVTLLAQSYGFWFPIHPGATALTYLSAVAKVVTVGFQINS